MNRRISNKGCRIVKFLSFRNPERPFFVTVHRGATDLVNPLTNHLVCLALEVEITCQAAFDQLVKLCIVTTAPPGQN